MTPQPGWKITVVQFTVIVFICFLLPDKVIAVHTESGNYSVQVKSVLSERVFPKFKIFVGSSSARMTSFLVTVNGTSLDYKEHGHDCHNDVVNSTTRMLYCDSGPAGEYKFIAELDVRGMDGSLQYSDYENPQLCTR